MSDFRLFENWRHENFTTSLLVFAMHRSPDFATGRAESDSGQVR